MSQWQLERQQLGPGFIHLKNKLELSPASQRNPSLAKRSWEHTLILGAQDGPQELARGWETKPTDCSGVLILACFLQVSLAHLGLQVAQPLCSADRGASRKTAGTILSGYEMGLTNHLGPFRAVGVPLAGRQGWGCWSLPGLSQVSQAGVGQGGGVQGSALQPPAHLFILTRGRPHPYLGHT